MAADASSGNRRKTVMLESSDDDDVPIGHVMVKKSSENKSTPDKKSASASKVVKKSSGVVKGKAAAKPKSKAKSKAGAKGRGKREESEIDEKIPGDARKYFKEGQKYITPPNVSIILKTSSRKGDGTRAFYESLYEENPISLIAIRFCVEYGVLIGTKHHEALAKYQYLREVGAYKGSQGGIQPEYQNGLPKNWEKVLAKAGKASPKKSNTKAKPN